jgi:hypothetical protein
MITASSGQHASETRFHIYLEISQLFTKPSVQTYFTLEINRSTISTLQNRRARVVEKKCSPCSACLFPGSPSPNN